MGAPQAATPTAAETQAASDTKGRDDKIAALRASPEWAGMTQEQQLAALQDLERSFNAEDTDKAQGKAIGTSENDPNSPFATKDVKFNAKNNPLSAPDLTDKAVRDARNAEFARVRAKRGRKSQFLANTGWEDPVAPLTSMGGNTGNVGPGY